MLKTLLAKMRAESSGRRAFALRRQRCAALRVVIGTFQRDASDIFIASRRRVPASRQQPAGQSARKKRVLGPCPPADGHKSHMNRVSTIHVLYQRVAQQAQQVSRCGPSSGSTSGYRQQRANLSARFGSRTPSCIGAVLVIDRKHSLAWCCAARSRRCEPSGGTEGFLCLSSPTKNVQALENGARLGLSPRMNFPGERPALARHPASRFKHLHWFPVLLTRPAPPPYVSRLSQVRRTKSPKQDKRAAEFVTADNQTRLGSSLGFG